MFEESSDNIKVVIRIRPPNQREIEANADECIFDGIEEDPNIPYNKSLMFGNQEENKPFTYDYIAKQDSTQQEIFQQIGIPLSGYALDGYNVCLFAYGQTGTGKTHTMYGKIGDEVQEGLQTRILKNVFKQIENSKDSQIITYAHYFEIYNENIIDLLNDNMIEDKKTIQIREDVKKGVYVENLQCKYVNEYQEAMEILTIGNKQRHIAETKMNMESSRSHSVFQFVIQQKTTQNGITNFKDSKINFVDLAGSERQKQTQASGDRLKEATNINKSLSILGRVINQLVEKMNSKKKNIHIPYRDSKLTFLLKDSLGGNAKTVMIATITASDTAYQETLSTLKFAQRAKMIENKAEKNEESSGSLALLQKEIKLLKKQIESYKDQIKKLENDVVTTPRQQLTDISLNIANEFEQSDKKEEDSNDLNLLEELQMLRDQLALKDHEINLQQIQFQEKSFDFDHLAQKHSKLEQQYNELQKQIAENQQEQIQQFRLSTSIKKSCNGSMRNINNGEKLQQPNFEIMTEQEEMIQREQISQIQQENYEDNDNNLKIQQDQNKSAIMDRPSLVMENTVTQQKIENLETENNFLNEKLKKFYALQERFLNQSQLRVANSNTSQIREGNNNNRSQLRDEDPFLNALTENEKLKQNTNDLIDEINELKTEIQKMNEDNDTLRETVFYVSSQLNNARKEKMNPNVSAVQFSRKTFSMANNLNSLTETKVKKNSNNINEDIFGQNNSNFQNNMTTNQGNETLDNFLSSMNVNNNNNNEQQGLYNNEYFQYYSNFKYQTLIDSVKSLERFYSDKNAIFHSHFQIYVFIVWQNQENIQQFLNYHYKPFFNKIQGQSGLILNLMGNAFNDEQLCQIFAFGLKKMTKLKNLDLNISHNGLCDSGLQELSHILPNLSRLENFTLNIQQNDMVTQNGILQLLEQIQYLPKLKSFKLQRNEIDQSSDKLIGQHLNKIGKINATLSCQLQISQTTVLAKQLTKQNSSNSIMSSKKQDLNETNPNDYSKVISFDINNETKSVLRPRAATSQRANKRNKDLYEKKEDDGCTVCQIF